MDIELSINVNEWIQDLERINAGTKNLARAIFKKAVQDTYWNVVYLTPVGNPALWKYPRLDPWYEPGTLKAAWNLTFDSVTEATISNYTPYAQRVEDGWSTQRPNGMLKVSLAMIPRFVEQAASAYFGNEELFNSGLYDRF